MSSATYEELAANRPQKFYANNRIIILMPHFKGEKSLEQISSETGFSISDLNRWINGQFSELAMYIQGLREDLRKSLEQQPIDSVDIQVQRDNDMLRKEVGDLYIKNIRLLEIINSTTKAEACMEVSNHVG